MVNVDSKIPNLALMKLSTYHKQCGHKVDIKHLHYKGYPGHRKTTTIDASGYHKVYVSTIFTLNRDVVRVINCDDVSFGGTGYDLHINLPQEIDDLDEDYSIYPENKKSYGFITRGCIRQCSFCFVPPKEGKLRFYRPVSRIAKHRVVEFLDNNFLAYDKHEDILQELIDTQLRCNFNQGLDIRLVTPRNAELLSKLNYEKEYIFAFDDIKYRKVIEPQYKLLKQYIQKDWKIKFFVLVGYNSSIKEDLERVMWCRENKALPYIMRHEKCWESENVDFYTDLASYCNQPPLFKNMTFEQFMRKRTTNVRRQERSIELWNSCA